MEPPPTTPSSRSRPSATTTTYLTLYNALSLLLWFSLLGRLVLLLPFIPPTQLHPAVSTLATFTQTLALLEPLHSFLHLIRSPLPTTLLQVTSRLFLIYGICYPFPTATRATGWYVSMLLAWSASEVLRYGYFVVQLRGGVPGFEAWGVPRSLVWARYNSFWVLYPVGIVSECVLVWRGSCAAGEGAVRWGLRAVLGAYVPGMLIF